MANYQFEVRFSLSDIVDVEADSLAEAEDECRQVMEGYYPVAPAGYSIPWDNDEFDLISSDGEDW